MKSKKLKIKILLKEKNIEKLFLDTVQNIARFLYRNNPIFEYVKNIRRVLHCFNENMTYERRDGGHEMKPKIYKKHFSTNFSNLVDQNQSWLDYKYIYI